MQFLALAIVLLTTLTSAQPISHLRNRNDAGVGQAADTVAPVANAVTPVADLLKILSPQDRLRAQCVEKFPGEEFVDYEILPSEKGVPILCKQSNGSNKRVEASEFGTPCTWIGACDDPAAKVTGRHMGEGCSATHG